MRIRVAHEITIAFPAPVRSLHLNLRLTPRSFESQYVQRWRVGVDLDARLLTREDAHGSVVHALSWHRPTASATISAGGEVQTSDAVGVVRGAVEPLPPQMYLRASPLAQANATLRELGESVGGAEPLDRLHRLMGALHRELGLTPAYGGEAPASEAFALKQGGAADFAHAFIALARAADIPARFVTGYRLDDASGAAAEMCAWAEAHAPGLGWIGFDAARNLCANDRYVRVAVGFDARDAAPLRAWAGGAATAMSVTLRVEQAGAQTQN